MVMGIGAGFKVKLVTSSEQTGVDGVEPLNEELANVWAEMDYVSQTKGFDANKGNYKTKYVFLIRYDSTILIDIRTIVEFNNHFYIISAIDRGRKGKKAGRYGFDWISTPTGMYWRIEATSQDIN